MISRVGIFFFLVGLLILLIAFGSNERDSQALQLFCIGFVIAFLGGLIWFRNREMEQPSRFRLIRKITSRDKD